MEEVCVLPSALLVNDVLNTAVHKTSPGEGVQSLTVLFVIHFLIRMLWCGKKSIELLSTPQHGVCLKHGNPSGFVVVNEPNQLRRS